MEKKRARRPGLRRDIPGTPAAPYVPKSIHVIHYTAEAFEEKDVQFAEDLEPYRSKDGVTWVNVDGLGNEDIILEIGRLFEIHPLAVEDVMSVRQRPKVDRYGTYLYMVIKDLHYERELWTEQVSIFLGPKFVLTFQERPGDCLETIREHLRRGTTSVRREGADYLMYCIVDATIDNYFPFLERVGETVEDLEEEVVARPRSATVARVHDVRRDLLDVRRAVWPLRDAVNTLLRDEDPLVGHTAQLYLRDCYDHTVLVLDIVETYREIAGGLMDVYLSSINVKMQEVMKLLTIIATIFMPISFIASVYGMNFVYLPEKEWRYGYFLCWGVMVLIALAMLAWFWRKGWLKRDR